MVALQARADAGAFDLSDSDGDGDDAPSAAAAPSESRVDPRVRCAVCALDLSRWSIQERAVHMNACLDAAAQARECACPTCGRQLTDYNEQRRTVHANLCLDRLLAGGGGERVSASGAPTEQPLPPALATDVEDAEPPAEAARAPPSDPNAYSCVICGVDLTRKDLAARVRHVKQCGQRFGVRSSDVAALQPSEGRQEGRLSATEDERVGTFEAEAGGEETTTTPTNAFAVMMRASSASASALTDTIGRVGHVVSNAFDVLMKSSKTQALAAATSSSSNSGGGGGAFQPSVQRFSKKRRVGASSWSHAGDAAAGAAGRRRPCPDFKRIQGTQPPFVVDGFQYASKALSSVYFLTHFHSDHYMGLDKRFDCGVIYCNAVTAALVVQELRIASKWVHPVPMNTPVTIHETQVTFMDANHCPGAAIILFRLKSGRAFLHTGDFRFHPRMLSYAPLQRYVASSSAISTGARSRLDGVYLDTTYADPKYVFPTQQTAIDHALELVAKHAASDKTLFLFGAYSIGKERLFMEVAAAHRRKVCVSKAKLKFIATFGWPADRMELLTTETGATNLHVVPMQDLKMEHLTALLDKHRLRFREIVAFRPTGWTFSKTSQNLSTCRTDATGRVRIYGVPYSEHSSFAELAEFVRALDPLAIVPTVNCHSDKAAKKQVDALRQVAFRSIAMMFPAPAAQQ